MFGWRGTILKVDLSTSSIQKEPLDSLTAKHYLGGRGINSKALFEGAQPRIDPLSPGNLLCLASGVFSGTPLGLSCRIAVSSLSPYSGILGDGSAGGTFAARLKWAGYDQIIIVGRADKPVYLLIEDERVRLVDGSDLWGRTTWETTEILKSRHGKGISVACVGQAGENLVRFASTIVDKYASAARGSGAVWGSKNLKAIVVRGSGEVALARPEEFKKLAGEDRDFFLNDPAQKGIVGVYGTHIGMMSWQPPYRHFEKALEPEEVPEGLTPQGWKQYETARTGCLGCPVRCKNVYRIPTGERAGEIGSALEYECISCLGTNCGIMDPVAIMEMGNLADAYGMDVLALGNSIAFVKELYHRGILDKEECGLDLEWENAASQIELIHRIALREGFGKLVAEGMYNIARIKGDEALQYCYHVKGLGRGPHPAGLFALAHATSTRGADHLRGRSWAGGENAPGDALPDLQAKGALPPQFTDDPVLALSICEKVATLADSIGRCKGAVNSWVCAAPLVWKHPLWDGLARLLTAATGIEFDPSSLEEAADRIYALERAFNAREGITRKHDALPQKPQVKDTPEGRNDLQKHSEMLTRYYAAHGYDEETGLPSSVTLERLRLEYAARELAAHLPCQEWVGPPLWPLDTYPSGGRRA